MAVPQTYEEYIEELGGKLSWFERLADSATGIDERLDLNNKLLIESLKLLREGQVQYPPKIYYRPNLPHYSVLTFPLDTARPDPGVEVPMAGDMITAFTDGSLDGVYIRPEPLPTDPIPLNEFNPYRLLPGWTSFWLETTSQPGKYLRLLVGEAASGEASVGTVRTNIIAQIVGVYLQPEWATLQGVDKTFIEGSSWLTWGATAYDDYMVPAHKTLFISGMSFVIFPQNQADADKKAHGEAFLENPDAVTSLGSIGGIGGGGLPFPRPMSVPGGERLRTGITNHSDVTVVGWTYAWGYEIVT